MPGRNCLEIALLQMVLPSPQVRGYVGGGHSRCRCRCMFPPSGQIQQL